MKRLDDPAALGEHLAENAAIWRRILAGIDTAPLELFGRVEAVALAWAALQREVVSPHGVNYAELVTLGMLRTSPDARRPLTQLRSLVGQSSAGMTRILDKLVAEGLVEREDGGPDRRRVDVRLTPRGGALAEKAVEALLGAQERVLGELAAGERRSLRVGLDALLRALWSR